jgi:hypothetical protein
MWLEQWSFLAAKGAAISKFIQRLRKASGRRQPFGGGHSLGQSSGKPRSLRSASYSAMMASACSTLVISGGASKS